MAVEETRKSVAVDGAESRIKRRVLPEEISKYVVALTCDSSSNGGTCDLYLVGTSHVSKQSCREVQDVIDLLRPEVVFLGLSPSRVAELTPGDWKMPSMSEMIDEWKKKIFFGILYSRFLSKVSYKLEVLPGSEFRVAFEQAKAICSNVVLGDRLGQVTLQSVWGRISGWHKTKLLYSLCFPSVFLPNPMKIYRALKERDDDDILTLVIKEMSKKFPTMMETLVEERDLFMSSTLSQVASRHTSVVAVDCKGHIQGINKHLIQPVKVDKLFATPPTSIAVFALKILAFASVGPIVAGVATITGLYFVLKRKS